MNDTVAIVCALFVGASMGAIFFGGLWWTVQKGVASHNPALWFLGSLLLRTSFVLTGFYFVSQGHWTRLVACLIGFVISRLFVVKRLAQSHSKILRSLQIETNNAS